MSIPSVALSHCGVFPIYQASLLLLLEKVSIVNHPALCFLVNGKYSSDYAGIFGMIGIQYTSKPQWNKVMAWLGEYVTELALASCKQVLLIEETKVS